MQMQVHIHIRIHMNTHIHTYTYTHTYPNPYINDVTYISVKSDWSDLIEKVEDIIINYKNYSHIPKNFRKEFIENYKLENICLHWYNIFKNLDTIKIDRSDV